MKPKKEIRLAEVELTEAEDKMILEGYAIIYNENTLIGNSDYGFIESITKEAITEESIKDVPLKYNHMDAFLIIARKKMDRCNLHQTILVLELKQNL